MINPIGIVINKNSKYTPPPVPSLNIDTLFFNDTIAASKIGKNANMIPAINNHKIIRFVLVFNIILFLIMNGDSEILHIGIDHDSDIVSYHPN